MNEPARAANDALPVLLPEVLTAEETATFLRLSTDATYVLLAQGKVPGAGKVGGAWRVHRKTLEAAFGDGSLVPANDTPRKLPRKRTRR